MTDAGIRLLILSPVVVIALVQGHRLRRDGGRPQAPTYGVSGMFYRRPPGWWWDDKASWFRPPDGSPHPAEPPPSPAVRASVEPPAPWVVYGVFGLFWAATLVAVVLILVVREASPLLLLGPYAAAGLVVGAVALVRRATE